MLFLRDNGIGISAEYLTGLEPFKRLHGQELSGSGIGLAVCKKTFERYGGTSGRIHKVGTGSTFYFTVPVLCSERDLASSKLLRQRPSRGLGFGVHIFPRFRCILS